MSGSRAPVDILKSTALFPRVYNVHIVPFLLFNAIGVFTALYAIWIVCAPLFIAQRQFSTEGILSAVFIEAFALFILFVTNRYVVLREDSIEVVTWMYRQRLTVNQIRGYYAIASRGYTYVFEPSDQTVNEIRLLPIFKFDSTFLDWKSQLPKIRQ